MSRVRLVCWKESQGPALAEALIRAGHQVIWDQPETRRLLQQLREDPPDMVVINLDRLPSHGRDLAISLRRSPATRHVPIMFAGGSQERRAKMQANVPYAVFADWAALPELAENAVTASMEALAGPSSGLVGYTGRSLSSKLMLKPGTTVVLREAPVGFESLLEPLPKSITLIHDTLQPCDVLVWFVTNLAELKQCLKVINGFREFRSLWIAWPKRTSGVPTDVRQDDVRNGGLAIGIVDYKICIMDPTWAGLCFTHRTTPGNPR